MKSNICLFLGNLCPWAQVTPEGGGDPKLVKGNQQIVCMGGEQGKREIVRKERYADG